MNKEHFKIAIKNLRSRSLRSWLTVLGVVIGIFLIVALLSLSEGIRNAILDQLKAVGDDVLTVVPGEGGDIKVVIGGLTLTDENIRAIEHAEGVDLAVPILWQVEIVRHKGEKSPVFLLGYCRKEAQDFLIEDIGFYLIEGDWPKPGRREVMVGNLVSREIFPGMEIGDEIIIEGKRFKVTGILRTLGTREEDSIVTLDLDYFRQVTGIREGAHFVYARIKKNFTPDEVSANIMKELEETKKRIRNVEPGVTPFTVFTREGAVAMVDDIMLLLQILIFGIAGISIIVSAIGIMNTMYTSVRERTKEIGIIKAVGAKNADIAKIFLIESSIIGLIGGVGGVILGIGLAKLIEFFIGAHLVLVVEAVVSPTLIIFALFFSFLLGCLAGYLPARSAAKLNPVDALDYE